jgi:hypothetical protein
MRTQVPGLRPGKPERSWKRDTSIRTEPELRLADSHSWDCTERCILWSDIVQSFGLFTCVSTMVPPPSSVNLLGLNVKLYQVIQVV